MLEGITKPSKTAMGSLMAPLRMNVGSVFTSVYHQIGGCSSGGAGIEVAHMLPEAKGISHSMFHFEVFPN